MTAETDKPGRSRFEMILKFADVVGTLAKPVTYVIAALALLAVSFPSLRRTWELWTLPYAWYQVGTLRIGLDGAIRLHGGQYDAAAWNGGVRTGDLFRMKGVDILTNGTSVGRTDPTRRSGVVTVIGENRCLHVNDVAFGQWTPSVSGKRSEADQAPASLLSKMTDDQRARLEAVLRRMLTEQSCQPLKAQEVAEARKADPTLVYMADPVLRVCPRAITWFRGKG